MNTKIIKPTDPSAVSDAVYVLANGGTVAAPTETCYGLLADAADSKAVSKIFKIKGRSAGKSVSVFVANEHMASDYARINPIAKKLIKKYLPGPLTVILGKNKPFGLAGNISKSNTIAIRISSHPLISDLVANFGNPMTATSANISGKPEIYDFKELASAFSGKVDLIVDAGNLKKVPPTTIVDATGKDLKIVRQGKLKIRI